MLIYKDKSTSFLKWILINIVGEMIKKTNLKEMDIHKLPDREFKISVSKKFCEPQRPTIIGHQKRAHQQKETKIKNIKGKIK